MHKENKDLFDIYTSKILQTVSSKTEICSFHIIKAAMASFLLHTQMPIRWEILEHMLFFRPLVLKAEKIF